MSEEFLNKENFSDRELQDLVYELDEYKFDTEEGDSRCWSRQVITTLNVNDRYFQIVWEQGLTENQEDQFDNQPYEVKLTQKEIITVVNNYTKI